MKNIKFWLVSIFLLGLILRLGVSLVGYHGDLNNNISWGTIAYEKGLNGFYEGSGLATKSNGEKDWPYSAPNQPPLTILTFALCRFVWQHLRDFIWYMNWQLLIFPSRLVWFWDDYGMTLLVKLPSIFADLGIAYLIYRYFKNQKTGLILSAVWLFNPVIWYNSSVWGQTDSVVNLLGLLAILFLLKKKLPVFAVLFTLSMLFKGSLSTFVPVLFFYALWQKYSVKDWFKAILAGLITVLMVSVWFHTAGDLIIWLIDLYMKRILPGEIGFLTANAYNFWWLVDPGKIYDSTLYFGLSARLIGFVIVLAVNAGVIFWLGKKPDHKRLLLSLLIVSLVSFLFMTRIHERYLYPYFPVSTLALGFLPGYWPVYGLFSLIHLINLYNLFWVPGIGPLRNFLMLSWPGYVFSAVNLILFLLSLRQIRRVNI